MMPNRPVVVALALLLGACGSYKGTSGDGPATGDSGGGPGPKASNCAELFTRSVQPRLEFCRNCHIAGGIADKDGGNKFLLSPTAHAADDLDKLRASWDLLKEESGSGPSRILTMASNTDPKRKHSGGAPWPKDGPAYNAMAAQLAGFDDPAACVVGAPAPVEADLLGSSHAKHLWASYCEGKPDDAVLPADPRTLVQSGNVLNDNRAVFFNAYWEDCHANAPAAEKQATTCGEFRARAERGKKFLMDELPTGATASTAYNDTYKKWGLAARPDNFDELYTLRYGLNKAPFDNPYPLPGEETHLTKDFGGTGQLPLGLRQTRDADGKYTGQIASGACFACHGGNYGGLAEENLGLGNDNYDVPMAGQDGSPFAGTPMSAYAPGFDINSLFNIGIKQRGQNNAVGAFELLMTALDVDSLGVNPQLQKTFFGGAGAASPQDVDHPIAHTQDTPAWWNYGHRPRKFFDAGVSSDSTRIIMAAGATSELLTGIDGKGYRDRIEKYDQDLEGFFLTLRSPTYPGPIDEALAKQGAVLFHSKDLWANTTDSSKPDYQKVAKPLGGNGSCASCHGAYSPRYVNDPAYLATPDLEGVAGHIEPVAMINTDPARSDMLTKTLRWGWDLTYWAYPEGKSLVVNGVEVAKYKPPYQQPNPSDPSTWVPTDPNAKTYAEEVADDNDPLRPRGACTWEKEVIGYQAPPLYGTWATAPYFHNGSVPTIEAVLNSKLRNPIWQRQLQTLSGVTGFDQRVDPANPDQSAYDFDALGWKSKGLACTDIPGTAQMNCSPVPGDQGPSVTQVMETILGGSWTGAVPIPDPAANAIDKRLVYDTRILGNKNTGHEFTDVLTDQERRAIIEYLKTL